ncbi:hypothetical protein TMatcc_003283 [Talaromyces marneffei ATCC 18224]
MASWLPIPAKSHFSLANIPFGIITTPKSNVPVPAIAIGEYALDLSTFTKNGGFTHLPGFNGDVFHQSTLNAFAALGRPVHRQIGDYTDFYAGRNHAYNVGVLFRGPDNALQPNYNHLPVGYHGRSSSIVVSGTPIVRPTGQILTNPTANPKVPILSPCKRLDIELEMAAFVGTGNKLGQPVPIEEAEDHIFGLVLMNDWSARDIQAWEYVPLGPFNSKNFATTISPWVVLIDALEPFRAQGLEPGNRDSILPYLREQRADNAFDIKLEFDIRHNGLSKDEAPIHVSETNTTNLLYSFAQMLTHHTITGCNLRTGDLLGSGTISGKEPGSQGSLLEQTNGGKEPLTLADGKTKRVFLEDGDEVILKAVAGNVDGAYVGFGECVGRIEPAVTFNF